MTREKRVQKNEHGLDEFRFYVKLGNMLGDLSSLSFQNHLIIKPIVKLKKKKIDSFSRGAAQGGDCRRPTAQDRAVLAVWCGKVGMALARTIRYLAPFQSVPLISHFHECRNYTGCHLKVNVLPRAVTKLYLNHQSFA